MSSRVDPVALIRTGRIATDIERRKPSLILVFNIRGNNYRLICGVAYANHWVKGTLFVKHFLPHAEYDKDAWKRDCER